MCVLREDLEIGSQGSQGVSDLSPLFKAACPPSAVGNKELAGVLMEDTGEEGAGSEVAPAFRKESLRSPEISGPGARSDFQVLFGGGEVLLQLAQQT